MLQLQQASRVRASRVIQQAFRRHVLRRRLRTLRSRRADNAADVVAHEAAVIIQRLFFRWRWTAQHASSSFAERAAMQERAAAVGILAGAYRAARAKRLLKQLREGRTLRERTELAEQRSLETSHAATMVQNNVRRLLLRSHLRYHVAHSTCDGRVLLQVEQEENYIRDAAVRIQRQVRRLLASQVVQSLRSERDRADLWLKRQEAHDVLCRSWRSVVARRTRVQLSAERAVELSNRRYHEAATMIQTLVRGVQARRRAFVMRLARRNSATLRIQCAWRQRMARNVFRSLAVSRLITETHKRIHSAATTVQSLFRGARVRAHVAPLLRAMRWGPRLAGLVGPAARGFVARRQMAIRRLQHRGARVIQRKARCFIARCHLAARQRIDDRLRRRQQQSRAAALIQALARGWLTRRRHGALIRELPRVVRAVTSFQRVVRCRMARHALVALRVEAARQQQMDVMVLRATLIQAIVRGFLVRLTVQETAERRDAAVALLQCCGRGFINRRALPEELRHLRETNAATRITDAFRSFLWRRKARVDLELRRARRVRDQQQRRAATTISAQWRGYAARRSVTAQRNHRHQALLSVQRVLRVKAAQLVCCKRQLIASLSVFASRIQRAWAISKHRVADRRLAAKLEAHLVELDLRALLKRETLDRLELNKLCDEAWSSVWRYHCAERDAIDAHQRQREERWLARTPLGVQYESAKRVQASVRSFAVRRRLLLGSGASDTDDAEWFEWLQGLHPSVLGRHSPGCLTAAERLVRELCAKRAQLVYEEDALRRAMGRDAAAWQRPAVAAADDGTTTLSVQLPSGSDALSAIQLREILHPWYFRNQLAVLHAVGLGLTDAAAREVAAFMEANPSLSYIDLRDNRFTDVGASLLCGTVAVLGRLITVDVSRNLVSSRYVKELGLHSSRRRPVVAAPLMRRSHRGLPFEPLERVVKRPPRSLLDDELSDGDGDVPNGSTRAV